MPGARFKDSDRIILLRRKLHSRRCMKRQVIRDGIHHLQVYGAAGSSNATVAGLKLSRSRRRRKKEF